MKASYHKEIKMAYTIEDYNPEIKEQAEKIRLARLHQTRQKEHIAQVMSELITDPRWEVLGKHAETVKQRYENLVKFAETTLNGSKFLDGTTYGQIKMVQAENRGVIKGIDLVLGMAKFLIEQGEEAMKKEGNLNEKEKETWIERSGQSDG